MNTLNSKRDLYSANLPSNENIKQNCKVNKVTLPELRISNFLTKRSEKSKQRNNYINLLSACKTTNYSSKFSPTATPKSQRKFFRIVSKLNIHNPSDYINQLSDKRKHEQAQINQIAKSNRFKFIKRPILIKAKDYTRSTEKKLKKCKRFITPKIREDKTIKLKERYNTVTLDNKRNKSEDADVVNECDFENLKFHRQIRKILITNLNMNIEFPEDDDFYKKFENQVNFIKDCYLVPYMSNTFQFKRKEGNLSEELNENLYLANSISREVLFALNILRRKKIFIEDKQRKLKTKYFYSEKKDEEESIYERHNQVFRDYFCSTERYKNVDLANDKVKKICFDMDSAKTKAKRKPLMRVDSLI